MRLGVNVLWNKRKHAFSEDASAEVEWKKSLLLNCLTDFRAVNGRGKVKFDVNRYSLPTASIISQLFPKTVEKQAISFSKLWRNFFIFHLGPSNLQVFLLSKLAFSIVFLCVLKLKSCRKPFQTMS